MQTWIEYIYHVKSKPNHVLYTLADDGCLYCDLHYMTPSTQARAPLLMFCSKKVYLICNIIQLLVFLYRTIALRHWIFKIDIHRKHSGISKLEDFLTFHGWGLQPIKHITNCVSIGLISASDRKMPKKTMEVQMNGDGGAANGEWSEVLMDDIICD